MIVMETGETKIPEDIKYSISNSLNTISSNCSISTLLDNSQKSKSIKVEDDRIMCSNSRSLDTILRTVALKIEQFAEMSNLGDEKSQFVSRVLEIFKDNIKENVTVNGLPYSPNQDTFSLMQKQEQQNEAKDALFSNLSKKVQVVAFKRKNYPTEYCALINKKLRQDLRKVKSCRIQKPIISKEPLQFESLSNKLEKVVQNFELSHPKIIDAVAELRKTQKNIKYAECLAAQKEYVEALCDTGYNSS